MRVAMFIVLALALLLAAAPGVSADKKARVGPGEGTRQLLDCSQAIAFPCGETLAGNNIGAPTNVTYYSCTVWEESGGEVVYEVVIPEPTYVTLSASISGMECDLDIFILGSCDESDCIAYGDYSVVANSVPPGTYYVVVDGYNQAECSYSLTVYCTPTVPECCPMPFTCAEFDFNESHHGFQAIYCGGAPVWEWGPAPAPGLACDDVPITNLLATVLDDDYPSDAGEIAAIGPILVTPDCTCLELCHAYMIEEEYDGGNVKVSTNEGATWDLLAPARGYDFGVWDEAQCIPNEPAFAHDFGTTWLRDCFDLSPYVGSEVLIGFFFGSDYSIARAGWYIKWAKIGTDQTPVESESWGVIKSLYK